MIRYFTLLPLLLLLLPILAKGQCNVNPGDDFCTLITQNPCENNIDENGVLSGTFSLGGNIDFTIPAECNGLAISLGSVTFNFQDQGTLTLADGVGITPDTDVAFNGTGTAANQNNATVNGGGVTFDLDGETTEDGDNPISDLVDAINNCDPCTTVGSAVVALPINLLSWKATPRGGDIVLHWSTSVEQDNDFYAIEHSTDGVTFSEMDRVSGAGTANRQTNYEYVHYKPGGGAHFYRLVQQDYDATRTTFGILSVDLGTHQGVIYPNPVRVGGIITYDTRDQTSREAYLYDMTGKNIAVFPTNQDGLTQSVLPADLIDGVYLLRYGHTTSRVLVLRP